jgi:hypothetical protein
VQIARNNAFTRPIERHETANNSYAPRMTGPAYKDGGALYWRVAAIDEGNNLGAWTTRSLSLSKRLKVIVRGSLHHGRRGVVKVRATDAAGHPVRRAAVRVTGPGVQATKRTGRKGTARFKLRPSARGRLIISVTRTGYQSGRASARIK